MRVSCKRTGGIAGLKISAEVDSERLPLAQAQEMRELVERARLFDQPAKPDVKSTPDQFQYEITVEDEWKRHSFVTNDAAASDELLDLIEWLIAVGRQKKVG